MKWGIVYNLHKKKSISLAQDIYEFLSEKHDVFIERNFNNEKKHKEYKLEEINKKADIVVTIGGDGTILRALEKVDKPIFAINSGGMGFLC